MFFVWFRLSFVLLAQELKFSYFRQCNSNIFHDDDDDTSTGFHLAISIREFQRIHLVKDRKLNKRIGLEMEKRGVELPQ